MRTRAASSGSVSAAIRPPGFRRRPVSASFSSSGRRRVPGVAPLVCPFLSMLSMDDTLKLLLRGWVPSGIAIGVSTVHVHGWAATPWRRGRLTQNMEMTAPTAGMALARNRAEDAARRSLVATRAEGLIAADVEVTRAQQSCGGGQGMLIEGQVAGTGVVRYRDPVVTLSAARNLTGVTRS